MRPSSLAARSRWRLRTMRQAGRRPSAQSLHGRYPALARFVPSLAAGIPLPATAPDLRDYHLDLIPSIVQFLTDLARSEASPPGPRGPA